MRFPENFRAAPLSEDEETADQVSPKAGLIWTPARNSTVRFAYSRALSGASLDQSYQLEPSQVAGFVQSYRSIIPESVAGANAGAELQTFGLSLEQKFDTGTYVGISGEWLNSAVDRTLGAFDEFPDSTTVDYPVPSELRQSLDYREQSLVLTLNQLLNKAWSFGARYRLSRAVLNEYFPDVPDTVRLNVVQPSERLESVLQSVDLTVLFNHPSGFFLEGDARWYTQSNWGYTPEEPGDSFWQVNLFAGYRFPRRRAEASVGLLNLTDQDYKLAPLNLHYELPRERTLAVRFQLNF
jgi:outer membrane receptor protein involved in Fe transport